MGSNKKEREAMRWYEVEKSVKAFIACLASFFISMVGGLVLTWWELKYHSTNSQLWMVPFALLLFVTPLLIGVSVFVSHFCNSKDANALNPSQIIISQGNSVHELREIDDQTSGLVIGS